MMDSYQNDLELPTTWTMFDDVRQQIRATIGCLAPETGGMLGGNRRERVVSHFYFDGTATRSGVTYSPDVEQCNRILTRDWNPQNIELVGFVHSHPHGCLIPSTGDALYASYILNANRELSSLLIPIVNSGADGREFALVPFVATCQHGQALVTAANIIDVDAAPEPDDTTFRDLEMFSRVRTAYDLPALERSRILAIGCGGSASFVEDLARAGVGEFVLIDPDVVTITNLATQQTYRRHLGCPKVSALADRIRDINPLAFVVELPCALNDLTDIEIAYLAYTPFRHRAPRTTLICGMTDDFFAQARVNRLALNFGLPSLCAQVYSEGRAAEVTFTHPEVTSACHRCLLASRYRAYLEDGFRNTVGSDGTPFASTARLNALKQFVAMALLHHATRHPRWANILSDVATRNLVQIRLDPDSRLAVFDRWSEQNDGEFAFCDETVWIPNTLVVDIRLKDFPTDRPHRGRR